MYYLYTVQQVSERAGIKISDLLRIEYGDDNISMGYYASVLHCLGLEKDIYNIATDDKLGRILQDIELLK